MDDMQFDDEEFYRETILDHYHASPRRGRIEAPDLEASLRNPLCGDHLHLALELSGADRIGRVRFDGEGCAVSQAAASLLAEHIEGRTLTEARAVTAEQMLTLIGMPLTPARRKCGLLAWRALQTMLPAAEA